MGELKTLKDLEENAQDTFNNGMFVRPIPDGLALRSVAREWIKELEIEFQMYCLPTVPYRVHMNEYIAIQSKINWIKHFFNLEEE